MKFKLQTETKQRNVKMVESEKMIKKAGWREWGNTREEKEKE